MISESRLIKNEKVFNLPTRKEKGCCLKKRKLCCFDSKLSEVVGSTHGKFKSPYVTVAHEIRKYLKKV